MFRIILSEKPSVSASIAYCVGANEKVSDGKSFYWQGNGYIVTNAIGHLFGIGMPEDYGYEKWELETLPLIPNEFKLLPLKGYGEQIKLLKKLLSRDDVSEVINACDAGREGECIFRYIYNYFGCKKQVKRLWISSLTDESIKQGMANLLEGREKDNLFEAGFTRAKADWILGMSLSRLYSIIKPVEFYAVRQMNDRKFAVVTLEADGLVDVVKPHIATVAEAKKALLEIYAGKKDGIQCEFVHPQTLDEKAIDMFKSLSKSQAEPDVIYRIKLNTDKNISADKTHLIQEYIKNENADTYAIGRIMAQGTYDECRKSLDELKNPKFEIYQIKSGDEYRDIRFDNYEHLTKNDRKVDFNNYDKVYEAPVSMLNTNSNDVENKLELIYQKFNTDHPDDFKGHSLSVSDVVVLDKKPYFVDSFGFKPLKEFSPPVQNKELSVDKAVDTPEKVEISKPKKLKL